MGCIAFLLNRWLRGFVLGAWELRLEFMFAVFMHGLWIFLFLSFLLCMSPT